MVRYWIQGRKKYPDWSRHIVIHVIGLILCVSILTVAVFEKFSEGGWVTLAVTSALIALCFLIKRHYGTVRSNLARLDDVLSALPNLARTPQRPLDPAAPTAVLLVGAYSGLGVHSLLTIQRLFPHYFRNFIFVSAGVIDSASFTGVEEVDAVRRKTEQALGDYVSAAHKLGLSADQRMSVGTDAVDEAEELCLQVSKEFPRSIFFAGKLIFQQERWFQRLLHNETAYRLQRRLQFAGLNAMVLPVRVLEVSKAA
jgi:K+ transporter